MSGIHQLHMPRQLNPLAMTYSTHSASKYTIIFQLGTSTHIAQDLKAMPHLVNVQQGVISSKKAGGKFFSSCTNMIGISFFILSNTSLSKVLLHNCLKNVPNCAISLYISLSKNPLIAACNILCKRM
jgi:hypothetical protein